MLAGKGQVWTRTQTCSPADEIASPCWVSRHCGEENCWSDSREGKHFSVEVERLEGLERELEEGRKWSLGIDRQLIRLEEQESGMGIFFKMGTGNRKWDKNGARSTEEMGNDRHCVTKALTWQKVMSFKCMQVKISRQQHRK